MRSSSSRATSSEPSPLRKNKSQSQREYRSKEMDGFTELRDALLLVDPFETPLGRDATRHQLLITAAKKLRNLADENQRLVLQLPAAPATAGPRNPETKIPRGTTIQNASIPWPNQGYGVEHLLSTTSPLVPPLRDYENGTPGWPQNPAPSYGNGRPSYEMALSSSCQDPQTGGMRRFF